MFDYEEYRQIGIDDDDKRGVL